MIVTDVPEVVQQKLDGRYLEALFVNELEGAVQTGISPVMFDRGVFFRSYRVSHAGADFDVLVYLDSIQGKAEYHLKIREMER